VADREGVDVAQAKPQMVTATCMSCGKFFDAPFPIMVEGGGEVFVAGLKIGPCPHCGGTGMVPDAHAQSLIDIMRGVARLPEEQLRHLRDALAATATEPETVADAVDAADPALAGVATWLRSSSNRVELVAWLTGLVALLAWLLPRGGSADSEQVEKVIVEIVDSGRPADWSKTGRNEQCPCRSGVKFKRCHGAPPTPWHLGDSEPPAPLLGPGIPQPQPAPTPAGSGG
jgi:hypothetical protein